MASLSGRLTKGENLPAIPPGGLGTILDAVLERKRAVHCRAGQTGIDFRHDGAEPSAVKHQADSMAPASRGQQAEGDSARTWIVTFKPLVQSLMIQAEQTPKSITATMGRAIVFGRIIAKTPDLLVTGDGGVIVRNTGTKLKPGQCRIFSFDDILYTESQPNRKRKR